VEYSCKVIFTVQSSKGFIGDHKQSQLIVLLHIDINKVLAVNLPKTVTGFSNATFPWLNIFLKWCCS